ncbi:MAG: hypothetical protein LBR36_06235 [Bacteroidales bacterium]|jgi:hypothetical protein|nr:hypothetical protein [Bacteroidales bacterium]
MKDIYSIFAFTKRALGRLQGCSPKCMSRQDSTFTKDVTAMQCVDYQAFTPPQLPDNQAVTYIYQPFHSHSVFPQRKNRAGKLILQFKF